MLEARVRGLGKDTLKLYRDTILRQEVFEIQIQDTSGTIVSDTILPNCILRYFDTFANLILYIDIMKQETLMNKDLCSEFS